MMAPKYMKNKGMSIRNWSPAMRRLMSVATAVRKQKTVTAQMMPRILAMMNTGR